MSFLSVKAFFVVCVPFSVGVGAKVMSVCGLKKNFFLHLRVFG